MKVELIRYTQNPLEVVYTAARRCYSASDAIKYPEVEKQEKLVKSILWSGHFSVLEHCSATFHIVGVSRNLTHQLVRHRIASYSQKSQRYCDSSNTGVHIPKSISNNPEALKIANYLIDTTKNGYNQLVELGIPKEDAREFLPHGTETAIVMTMNFRSWMEFLNKRMCTRAQLEIRTLAKNIYDDLNKIAPWAFGSEGVCKGAFCDTHGFCPERDKSCGKRPQIQKLLDEYYNMLPNNLSNLS